MIIYPKAKINLGLRVVEKRLDGFHNLESLFISVPTTTDILEIIESDKLSFSIYGAIIDCEPGKNICENAFRLLANDFNIPGADIHLYKNIPSGAGLGGGSSDGACTLILLNKLYKLGLDTVALQNYAALLGSDCPYFILAHEYLTHEHLADNHSPVIVTGKGDILERYPLDILNNFTIKIVSPGIFISTVEAYSGIVLPNTSAPSKASNIAHQDSSTPHQGSYASHEDSSTLSLSLKDVLQMPPQEWKTHLVNDFEKHIFKKYPQLVCEKELLYEQGAIYASMTGSGSSLFGLFPKRL